MKKMSKKLLVTIAMLGVVSSSVYAGTMLEKVTAYRNADMKYTLNGKEVLQGEGALVYQDSVYVPLRKVSETLDVQVDYTNGQVMLTQKEVGEPFITEPIVTENEKTSVITGIVKNIELQEITILPEGKSDMRESVIVDISKVTSENVNIGDKVSVTVNNIFTKSIPTKATAVKVVNLTTQDEQKYNQSQETKITYKESKILSIDKKNKQIFLDTPTGEVVINVTPNTVIKHEKNKKIYTFEDISEKNILKVTIDDIMTLSLPPMTNALEIIIVS